MARQRQCSATCAVSTLNLSSRVKTRPGTPCPASAPAQPSLAAAAVLPLATSKSLQLELANWPCSDKPNSPWLAGPLPVPASCACKAVRRWGLWPWPWPWLSRMGRHVATRRLSLYEVHGFAGHGAHPTRQPLEAVTKAVTTASFIPAWSGGGTDSEPVSASLIP